MSIRTDYARHNAGYIQLENHGHASWSTDEERLKMWELLDQTLRASYFPKTGNVLEVGCGTGHTSAQLSNRGYTVTGIDISEAAIRIAKRHVCDVTFLVGNVLDMCDVADKSFDAVIDGHCLHCIIGNDRSQFFAEVMRVLVPGGILHVASMVGAITMQGVIQNFDHTTRRIVHGDCAWREIPVSVEAVSDEVTNAGCEVVHSALDVRIKDDDADEGLVDARKPG